MTFHFLTIFPKIFDSYLNEGILARARKKKIVRYKIHNLRDWTYDRHRSVDDSPYGGGAGMLMKVKPIYLALKDLEKASRTPAPKRRIILLAADGKKWTQAWARRYARLKEIVFVCGRYEGVDERAKKFVDETISVGDYVLTGGELPALAITDSIVRLLPGVLGNRASLSEESHGVNGLGEYPQYTRPEIFLAGRKKYAVPKILLTGDPKKIRAWREKHRK